MEVSINTAEKAAIKTTMRETYNREDRKLVIYNDSLRSMQSIKFDIELPNTKSKLKKLRKSYNTAMSLLIMNLKVPKLQTRLPHID